MITEKVKNLIKQALVVLNYPEIDFVVEKSKFINQGDINTNIAMLLKKSPIGQNKNPLEIANEIVDHINKKDFEKVEVAKPGFINFFLKPETTNELIQQIQLEKEDFPHFDKKDEIISVEWVSANPTGYLHIGHARNAALGEVISKLYEKIGYSVIRDYVVNDAGNQMNVLATAVLIRYLQLFNIDIQLPQDSYHGDEIKLVAQSLKEKFNDKFINEKIDENNKIINDENRTLIRHFARDYLLNQIKNDLKKLDIELDEYYSEESTHVSGKLNEIIERLKKYTYKHEGALWLKTSEYGDDKDRVLLKSDGVPTYFLPDVYYHDWKLRRNNKITKLVHVWGSDHYSYLVRVRAALKCLGYENVDDMFKVIFMQMVKLVKNGQEFKMSKRTGQSLTLVDLVDAIGKDSANWFLISANASNHLEIDVDVALKHDSNNPIYYVQYASARASKLLNKINFKFNSDIKYLNLNLPIEKEIINHLHFYKQTILFSINNFEPQKLVNYIYTLAKLFHSYYEQVKILDESNSELTNERLALVSCVKLILQNSLSLINISAKNEM